MISLADLAECFSGRRADTLAASRVRGFTLDNRTTGSGDVFVAIPGERVDGADFVKAAFDAGAIGALVRRDAAHKLVGLSGVMIFDPSAPAAAPRAPMVVLVDDTERALQDLATWWRRKFDLAVIGVTGSVGKTTTKELIAQVLSTRFNVLKSEGNQNNALGVPLTLLKLNDTHQFAVLEMGMDRLGEIASYCSWAQPNIGVLTNIGPVHLEKLGSIENIALAKSELPRALPEGGLAILNDDDPRVKAMAGVTRADVLSYGLTSQADVWADDINGFGLAGVAFTLHHAGRSLPVRLKMLGEHSVQTALRAAAVGLSAGMSLEEVIEGLRDEPTQLRLVVADGPHGSIVLDDTYNASPESTIAALNLLREIDSEGVRVAVLGDMFELGDAETTGHEEVGCRAALVAGLIVCVGERSKLTAQAARECGAKAEAVIHVMTNEEAVRVLRARVTTRSVILVKGSRGMKMEQIVAALGSSNGGSHA
jgi:UDP-N-acetylmuramoyl-tripeptide--D-alanyl-D-alanine ligase